MLKETLLKLQNDAGSAQGACTMYRNYNLMDEATQKAFVAVCQSAATTTDIAKALRADGMPISRDILSRRRKCFTEQIPECCMQQKRPQ